MSQWTKQSSSKTTFLQKTKGFCVRNLTKNSLLGKKCTPKRGLKIETKLSTLSRGSISVLKFKIIFPLELFSVENIAIKC